MKFTTPIAAAIVAFVAGAAALPQASEASAQPTTTAIADKKGVLVLYTDKGDGEEFNADSYWPGVVQARSTPGEPHKFTPVSQFHHHHDDKGEAGHVERRSLSDTSGPVIEIMPEKREALDKRIMWINKQHLMAQGVKRDASPIPEEHETLEKRIMWINKQHLMAQGVKREAPAMPAPLHFHPTGEYKPGHGDKKGDDWEGKDDAEHKPS